jgi:hypothetical protein
VACGVDYPAHEEGGDPLAGDLVGGHRKGDVATGVVEADHEPDAGRGSGCDRGADQADRVHECNVQDEVGADEDRVGPEREIRSFDPAEGVEQLFIGRLRKDAEDLDGEHLRAVRESVDANPHQLVAEARPADDARNQKESGLSERLGGERPDHLVIAGCRVFAQYGKSVVRIALPKILRNFPSVRDGVGPRQFRRD